MMLKSLVSNSEVIQIFEDEMLSEIISLDQSVPLDCRIYLFYNRGSKEIYYCKKHISRSISQLHECRMLKLNFLDSFEKLQIS